MLTTTMLPFAVVVPLTVRLPKVLVPLTASVEPNVAAPLTVNVETDVNPPIKLPYSVVAQTLLNLVDDAPMSIVPLYCGTIGLDSVVVPTNATVELAVNAPTAVNVPVTFAESLIVTVPVLALIAIAATFAPLWLT